MRSVLFWWIKKKKTSYIIREKNFKPLVTCTWCSICCSIRKNFIEYFLNFWEFTLVHFFFFVGIFNSLRLSPIQYSVVRHWANTFRKCMCGIDGLRYRTGIKTHIFLVYFNVRPSICVHIKKKSLRWFRKVFCDFSLLLQ